MLTRMAHTVNIYHPKTVLLVHWRTRSSMSGSPSRVEYMRDRLTALARSSPLDQWKKRPPVRRVMLAGTSFIGSTIRTIAHLCKLHYLL